MFSSKARELTSSLALRLFAAPTSSTISKKYSPTRAFRATSSASSFRIVIMPGAPHPISSARLGSTSRSRSFVNTVDAALAQAWDVAQALIGQAVAVRHHQARGGNSRIYRVDCGEQAYALKQYPSREDDPRDRLTTEVRALRLVEHYQVQGVPRAVGVDRDRGYALLSWIEGAEVAKLTDADIDVAVAFLASVHALRETPWAAEQPLASEACLSGEVIERQLSV